MKRRILIIALISLLIIGLALFFFLNKEEEIIEPNYRYAEAVKAVSFS